MGTKLKVTVVLVNILVVLGVFGFVFYQRHLHEDTNLKVEAYVLEINNSINENTQVLNEEFNRSIEERITQRVEATQAIINRVENVKTDDEELEELLQNFVGQASIVVDKYGTIALVIGDFRSEEEIATAIEYYNDSLSKLDEKTQQIEDNINSK